MRWRERCLLRDALREWRLYYCWPRYHKGNEVSYNEQAARHDLLMQTEG